MHIHGFERTLMDEISLRVHVIAGDRFAVLVDTAMIGYEDMMTEALDFVRQCGVPLAFIVNTHAHHDHIGLNRWVQDQTGAKVLSHPWGSRWIADPDVNYQEFVLGFPDIIADTKALRQEVRGTLGDGVPLDMALTGGDFLYPGGLTLEIVETGGHVPGEIGILVREARALILGDAFTALNLPFFHGHVRPALYHRTLKRVRSLVEEGRVDTILSAHLPPWVGVGAILAAIEERQNDLDRLEAAILEMVAGGANTLISVWQAVSQKWNKLPEFRGLAMISAHLDQLVMEGRIDREGIYYAMMP